MSITSESTKRINDIIYASNKQTGFKHVDLKSSVQSLCDGYSNPKPLYSFGALSDLHIQYETGVADFQRALTYLKDKVAFTCVAGDLVSYATEEHMSAYKTCVDNYAGDMLIFECSGNHETYPELGVGANVDETLWTTYTGKSLYYSFNYDEDVFIMFGMKSERSDDLFPDGALEWLQVTLEENKNKRCFVFMHAPELVDKTADPSETWSSLMNGTSGKSFVELLKQYKNTIWFHGHTHVTLGVEHYPVSNGVSLGYRSVHIPSLVSPRFYDSETNTLTDYYYDENNNKIWGSTLSEGYIVDVYKNKIVLRGINFAAGTNKDQVEPMNNEIYAIDTTQFIVTSKAIEDSGIFDTTIEDGLLDNSLTGAYTNDRITSVESHRLRSSKLTAFNSTSVTSIGQYAFYSCALLEEVNIPNLKNLTQCCFQYCTALKRAVFPNAIGITGQTVFGGCTALTYANLGNVSTLMNAFFQNCSALETVVILREENAIKLNHTNAFIGTPIANGTGFVYVPDDLVDTYKTATNWSTYAAQIKPLSELPEEV